jgi:anti-sigma regulatory factor (Ser/Thr protein kinase)
VANHGLQLTLDKDLADLDRLITAGLDLLEYHQVPPKETYAVRLALEELYTNAVKFTRQAPYSDAVRVALSVEDQEILLSLEYEGPPFDPREAPEPDLDKPLAERKVGGLGLMLVRSMVDDLAYSHVTGTNRIEVTIAIGQE